MSLSELHTKKNVRVSPSEGFPNFVLGGRGRAKAVERLVEFRWALFQRSVLNMRLHHIIKNREFQFPAHDDVLV